MHEIKLEKYNEGYKKTYKYLEHHADELLWAEQLLFSMHILQEIVPPRSDQVPNKLLETHLDAEPGKPRI